MNMNNSDRCDRCTAQAYVLVSFATGTLLFCGHHFDEYSPSFPAGFNIEEDERKALTSV